MKQMKRQLLLVCGLLTALFFSYSASAQADSTLTLQQCVEMALSNNLTVRQSGLQSESADANLKQAKANRLPLLSMDINHGINQGRWYFPVSKS
jgi:outer membrane protein